MPGLVDAARARIGFRYEAFPAVLQDAMCSVYGARERARREGPRRTAERTRQRIEELHHDTVQRRAVVDRRLRRILRIAAKLEGYHALGMDRGSTDLRDWPILTKDHIRAHADALLARRPSTGDIETWTSGTTGSSLSVWKPQKLVRELFLSRDVFNRWFGVEPYSRRVTFSGKLVVPRDSERIWRLNVPGKQVLLSQYHLGPEFTERYIDVVQRWHPRVMSGFPSTMAALARMAEEMDEPLHIPFIETSGEMLLDGTRELLERAFSATVADKYGSSENAAYACECPEGNRHVFENFGLVEVVDEAGLPLPDGESGRLVLTNLVNDVMPLVRYEVGDRGAISRELDCPCGRTSAILVDVEGRQDDTIVTADGRHGLTSFVFNTLRGTNGVEAMQIVQREVDDFEVRAVLEPAGVDRQEFEATILRAFQRLLGTDAQRHVAFRYDGELELTPGGKIRNTIRMFE